MQNISRSFISLLNKKLGLFIFLVFFCFLSKTSENVLQLAKLFPEKGIKRISDYYVSEKLDGVRAYWDGENLLSKKGNKFIVPNWFIKDLPKSKKLDGELWISRGQFQETISIVKTQTKSTEQEKNWKKIKFKLFDIHNGSVFEQRYKDLLLLEKKINKPHVSVIKQFTILSEKELFNKLESIVKAGGEGLILHKKKSLYNIGRTNDVFKLKPSYDAEATVLSQQKGNGKYKGLLGAITVKLNNSTAHNLLEKFKDTEIIFKIGTGFTDEQRKNPPKIGDIITFKYIGFTNSGIPKFASYLRTLDKTNK